MNRRSRSMGLLATAFVLGCFDPGESVLGDTGTSTGTPTSTSPVTDGAMTTVADDSTSADPTTLTSDATDSADTAEDDTTSGPQDSTDTSGSSAESDSETTRGVDPFCGDGRVNGDEVCDDAVNAGAVVGDCAPDCSKEVEARIIRLSQNSVPSNFSLGNPNFIAEADTHCPAGYAALMADGSNRVASLAPLTGNGQVDWPIERWTSYVNAAGGTVWTTTELRLIGVDDGNAWVGLLNPVSGGTEFAFTGMFNDFTTSDLTCVGFTVNAGMNGINRASFGFAGETDQTAIGSAPGLGGGCGVNRFLYCVEL